MLRARQVLFVMAASMLSPPPHFPATVRVSMVASCHPAFADSPSLRVPKPWLVRLSISALRGGSAHNGARRERCETDEDPTHTLTGAGPLSAELRAAVAEAERELEREGMPYHTWDLAFMKKLNANGISLATVK